VRELFFETVLALVEGGHRSASHGIHDNNSLDVGLAYRPAPVKATRSDAIRPPDKTKASRLCCPH
jgi:hypothetical protein